MKATKQGTAPISAPTTAIMASSQYNHHKRSSSSVSSCSGSMDPMLETLLLDDKEHPDMDEQALELAWKEFQQQEDQKVKAQEKTQQRKQQRQRKRSKAAVSSTFLTLAIQGNYDTLLQVCRNHTFMDLCQLLSYEWNLMLTTPPYKKEMKLDPRHPPPHSWSIRDYATGEVYMGTADLSRCPLATAPDKNPARPTPPHLKDMEWELSQMASFRTPGSYFQITYHHPYGSIFSANLQLLSLEKDEQVAQKCPRSIIQGCTPLQTLKPYQPPAALATLNERYPNLSKLLEYGPESELTEPPFVQFGIFCPSREDHQAYLYTHRNVAPTASPEEESSTCRQKSVGGVIWLPERFPSMEEMFLALEAAAMMQKEEQEETGDNQCTEQNRIIYPVHVPRGGMRRYNQLMRNSQNPRHPPVFHIQEPVQERDVGYFAQAFPKCHRAFLYHRRADRQRAWIHYDNGLLKLCRASGRSSPSSPLPRGRQDLVRGFAPEESNVVAKINHKFSSLHGLFCTIEALWQEHLDDEL